MLPECRGLRTGRRGNCESSRKFVGWVFESQGIVKDFGGCRGRDARPTYLFGTGDASAGWIFMNFVYAGPQQQPCRHPHGRKTDTD